VTTQPQLLQMALTPSDVVYTPDWVAKDMVDYFKPSGRILEPCAGDGVFLRYLPNDAEWCEIEKGRDFFAWTKPVDWIVGNPPFSDINKWVEHSFACSENVLFLMPMNKPFNSLFRMKIILEYGKIVALRAYGHGSLFGMDYGFAIGAFWFQRGYKGKTEMTVFE
jgi:hypothetical protein